MMRFPGCPQTLNELEELLMTITDPKYDQNPEEYKRRYEKIKSEIAVKGRNARDVRIGLLTSGLDVPPELFERDFKNIVAWGRTREESFEHYLTHFFGEDYGPCEHCNGLYDSLCLRRASEIADDNGIDLAQNPEKLDELVTQAGLEYWRLD